MAFLPLLKPDRTADDLLSAQALVTTICNVPRLDTLHALILIAWADFKRERYTEFTAYGRVCPSLPVAHYKTDQHHRWPFPWPRRSALRATLSQHLHGTNTTVPS